MSYFPCLILSLVLCMPALAQLSTPDPIDQEGVDSKVADVRDFESDEEWDDAIMDESVAMSPKSASKTELDDSVRSSLSADVRADSGSVVEFRAGLIGGFGVEYIKDISPSWQAGIHASSWLLFSEAGADIRYFFRRSSDEGFYIGAGARILNSPLIFTLGLGPNFEFGYEKRNASGLYYGVGVGATVLYVPYGVSAEGHGFEGVLPGIVFRVRKGSPK
jgi:hypothetical protein